MLLPQITADYSPGMSCSPTFRQEDVARVARNVFEGTPIVLAYAYGSRVTGNASPGSDLDVGYFLSGRHAAQPLSVHDEMVLADRMSRRIGVEVDLRNVGLAPLEWQARVIREGVLIVSRDEPTRVEIERGILVRWFDEQQRLDRFHNMRLEAFAAAGLRKADAS
jgi:predicted nucleotidyltransferase